MKALAIFLIPFLFLLVSTIPAYALPAIDVNVSSTSDMPLHSYGIACTNITGTFYCYVNEQCNGGSKFCISRYNATWANRTECQFEDVYSFIPRRLWIVNSTHVGMSRTGFTQQTFIVDISDIATNASCPYTYVTNYTFKTSDNDVGAVGSYFENVSENSWAYFPKGEYARYNSLNFNDYVNFSTNDSVYYWNDINTYSIYGLSFPDQTTNLTAYGTEARITNYLLYNQTHIYKIASGVVSASYDNPFVIYGIQALNTSAYYHIDFFKESAGTTWLYMLYNARLYRMNWSAIDNTTYSTSCDWTDEPIGTTCDQDDSTHRTYITNSNNCALEFGACPENTRCVPLTPQYNASFGLTENIADCSRCYFLQQWYISNHSWMTVRTNCENTMECLDTVGSFSIGVPVLYRVVWGTGVYHYNQTIPTGTLATIPKYTIYCQNNTDGSTVSVIDENGNTTDEKSLIYTETGILINETATEQESTTGDSGTTGLKEWLNAGMGTSFGADIISLIVAGVCAILVFINVNKDDKNPALMFGTFMLVASVFSFVGLLTMWFLVLEVTLIGVIIFWKAKGG